ncbi:MAG: hypothetical protein HYZ29_23335 [Myxococcales bacterium]|nr:hypothetical protein [Myxococcales bacterium]
MHQDTAFLGGVVRAVKKGSKALKKAARRASPIASEALRFTPAGAAAAAMGAVSAAQGIARGDRWDKVAASAARGAVPGGALGRAAFDAGLGVARGQRIDRAALAAARSAATETLRGAAPGVRLPGFIDPMAAFGRRAVAEMSTVSPAVALAARALKRAPTLTAASVATVAKTLGVPPQVAQDAMRLVGPRSLPWRPMSRRAARFLRRFSHVPERALTLTRDTGALTVGPARIKLQSGDLPYLIAKKYAGDQTKWSQIATVNPGMKVVHNKDKAGKVIWSGLSPWYANLEVNLPPTWPNLPGGAAPAPSVPGVPTIPVASEVTTASILQAKATLAAWSKTDGASSAGVADYGTKLEDASPAWGARDRFTLSAFSAWWNKSGKTPALGTSGELSAAHSDALRAWVEGKAAAPSAPAPTTPKPPQELPPMVIPGGTAPLPQWPPAQTDPAHPVDPWPTPPALPSLPTPPGFQAPQAPGAPAPAPAQKKGDDLGVLAALGALVALLT